MKTELTIWQSIKFILHCKLLTWALDLLPKDIPEYRELGTFIINYMKRSIQRATVKTKVYNK